MIEAGLYACNRADPRFDLDREIVCSIYRAMQLVMRTVGGVKWCCLSSMGIKRLDIVSYKMEKKEQYSFAGGHRHRYLIARDDIHLLFPPTAVTLDIADVKPAAAPAAQHRHNKRR